MKKLFIIILLLNFYNMSDAQTKKLTPEEIVQMQTDKYNAHDLEGFMSYFTPDVKVYNFRTDSVMYSNYEEYYKVFKEVFELSPELHSSTVNRIVYGNIVIEHERILGRKGSKVPLDIIVITEIVNEKINKVSFIRPE
jgi:hypothetical protein